MKAEYTISTDKSKLDIDTIHNFLSTRSYWAIGRSRQTVEKSIANSLCFGIYNNQERMVGFARVATDYALFAYIMDVFVLEEFRGKGLGKMLVSTIIEHPEISQLKRIMLATKDAHALYNQFGFTPLASPENFMERIH